MVQQQHDIEIQAEEIRELLTSPPSWPMKWGIISILTILSLLGVFAAFIKIPERIEGEVIIRQSSPVKQLYAPSDGFIEKILIKVNHPISKGNQIAKIKSTNTNLDVDKLAALLNELGELNTDSLHLAQKLKGLYLGLDFMDHHQELGNAITSLVNLNNKVRKREKLAFMQTQKSLLHKKLKILEAEELIQEWEIELARKNFKADSQLYAESVTSAMSFRSKKTQYLNEIKKHLGQGKLILQAKTDLSRLQDSKMEYLKGHELKKIELESRIESLSSTLQNLIEAWRSKNFIIASDNGVLRSYKLIYRGQRVKAGELIYGIESRDHKIEAIAIMDKKASGKIEIGQKVLIDLYEYPAEEFGRIHGSIKSLNRLAYEDEYQLQIELDRGLLTNRGTEIAFRPELSGKAMVICNSRSILQKIFDRLLKAVEG